MNRTPNRLSGVPLSPFSWQIEAFKAAAEANARAAARPDTRITKRERLWIRRGEALGRRCLRFVAHFAGLRHAARESVSRIEVQHR